MITVYAVLNGVVFESNESENLSNFAEIPINKETEVDFNLEMLQNEIENKLNTTEIAENKFLEKVFFKKIFEIIIHLTLSVLIFSIAYEHSYIESKIDSNSYIIHSILAQDQRNQVSNLFYYKHLT
jgi:hypothetical protein